MRSIINELKQFIRKDFNPWAYGVVIILLTAALIYNFSIRFEKTVIYSHYGEYYTGFVFFLYYAVPYFTFVFVSLTFKKRLYRLKQTSFWIKSILFIAVFAFLTSSKYHVSVSDWLSDTTAEHNYLLIVTGNLKRLFPMLLIFAVISFVFDKNKHLYGIRFNKTNYRPYFIMLAIVLPLIIAASYTDSFQHTYPKFKPWYYGDLFGWPTWKQIAVFETAYGLDFISIELMFRGAMVIGLAKLLEEDAVLPMAALYVVIHFGKPPLEAISSFFGGFILGVHSYYTKHIMGGIIVHMGLAWMMEIAAHMQHAF